MMSNIIKLVGVIGANTCDQRIYALAEKVGEELAKKKLAVICGGLGGVMEAVCKGNKSYNGTTIGILPGDHPEEANQYVDIAIPTGMGIARNIIIVRAARIIIAIDGKYGTLSELAYALQLGRPVIGLETWDVSDRIITVSSPEEAAGKACDLIK